MQLSQLFMPKSLHLDFSVYVFSSPSDFLNRNSNFYGLQLLFPTWNLEDRMRCRQMIHCGPKGSSGKTKNNCFSDKTVIVKRFSVCFTIYLTACFLRSRQIQTKQKKLKFPDLQRKLNLGHPGMLLYGGTKCIV